jgi:hypothetical protein
LTTEVIARVYQRDDIPTTEDAWREACEAWLILCGEAAGYRRIMKSMGEEPDPAKVRHRAVAELIVEILDSVFFSEGRPDA